MKRFALLGEVLGHSFSPVLHKAIYRQLEIDDADYRSIELPASGLKSFFSGFRVGGFDGVNVTIPHKSAVIEFLDELDSKARLINAVNCIHRKGTRLIGFNTDVLGFLYSLRQHGVQVGDNSFLILGAGGSAQAVAVALAQEEAGTIYIINRTAERADKLVKLINRTNDEVKTSSVAASALADIVKKVDCIVNTTSVGMTPDIHNIPIPADLLNSNLVVFDLVYNPQQTRLLAAAEQAGAKTINGLQMLVAQAVYSVEIWMGGNVISHIDMNALVRDLQKTIK